MDKPAGITSHDVVARARRILGVRAVGHTGTLDPFATGLLVLLVGRATRVARFVEAEAKTYLATARLGSRTDTDDATGTEVDRVDLPPLDTGAVEAALAGFAGPQRQRPPAYSAKRVGGERSYRKARRGEAVELAETEITVHRIELLEVATPFVTFRATVSAGTYLRAIARDLGERLGVGAHLTALRREAIGALRVEEALPLDAVGPGDLRAPLAVLGHLPRIEVDAAGRAAVAHGRPVRGDAPAEATVALVQGGELLAVGTARDGVIRPIVVLEAA